MVLQGIHKASVCLPFHPGHGHHFTLDDRIGHIIISDAVFLHHLAASVDQLHLFHREKFQARMSSVDICGIGNAINGGLIQEA